MWKYLIALTAIAISLAGSAWYGHSKGRQSGMREVQTLWDSERLATTKAQTEELMKAREREQSLQDLAAKLRLEKRREADRLAREYAADLERLRDRPEERAGAGGVPDSPSAGVGCTGAGLARPDAAFLTGYAYDAARLEASLRQCVSAYNSIREALNGSH